MKLRPPLPARRNRLEIVPLIDIMFFLLASFMLVSLTLSRQQTIRVKLPTAQHAPDDFQPDQLNLAVDPAGLLYLGEEPITLPNLETALAARFREDPATPVYLSGDKDARHGAIITLLDAVRRAGFEKISFQVDPAQSR